MRRLLWIVLLLCGCHREPPAWTDGLTDGVTEIRVRRGDREARLFRDASGLWRESAPHHGEADPRAVTSLLNVLAHPQIVDARWSGAQGPVATRVELVSPLGTHVVELEQAALGAPVPLVLDGRARFLGAPLELSTKVPDPEDYFAPALWMSAEHHDTVLKVSGRASYVVTRVDDDHWTSTPPATHGQDLDDFAGAITGRQVAGFPPPGPPERFGLDHPALTAVLCTGPSTCRTFRFGEAGGHVYAEAPQMDVVELRDDVWRMLLRGP